MAEHNEMSRRPIWATLLLVGLAGVAVLLAPTRARAAEPVGCSKTFVPVSGAWNVGSNWSPAGVPSQSDAACINAGQTATVPFTAGTVEVGALAGDGGLNIGSSPAGLGVVNESSIGSIVSDGGSLAAGPSLTVQSLTWNNTGTMSGTLTVRSFIWNAGTLTGTMTVPDGGSLQVAGASNHILNGTLNLAGAGRWENGDITGNGALNVSGTLSYASSTTTLRPALANTGTLVVERGSLRVDAYAGDGAVSIGAPATLDLPGDVAITRSLEVRIGGAPDSGNFSHLIVRGAVTVGGTLRILPANGFGPTEGQSWDVATYTSRSGDFDTVEAGIGRTEIWEADRGATKLSIRALTDAGDLAVASITAPADAAPGETAGIDYRVENRTSTPVEGTWVDSLYLSRDSELDDTDLLITRVEQDRQVTDAYEQHTDVTMPPEMSGLYRVIVVVDSRGQSPDVTRRNNTAFSGSVRLEPPALRMGETTSGSVAGTGARAFRLDVPNGTDAALAVGFGATEGLEVLVRHGAIPTATTFDRALRPADGTTQEVVLGAASGAHYVVVHGTAQGDAAERPFELRPRLLDLAITRITPDHGSNAGRVTVTVEGAGFGPGTSATLLGGDGSERPAAEVVVRDRRQLAATFDLAGLAPGAYDLRVSNGPDSQRLEDGFTVNAGEAGRLEITIDSSTATQFRGAPAILTRRPWPFSVVYRNVGETDVAAALVTVHGENVVFRAAGAAADSPRQQFLAIGPAGSPATIPPGGSGTLRFMAVAPQAAPYRLTANLIGDPAAPVDWAGEAEALRPTFVPADAWAAILPNLMADAGATRGEFEAYLRRLVIALDAVGVTTSDVGSLLSLAVLHLANREPGLPAVEVVDATVPAAGVPLEMRRFWRMPISDRFSVGPFGRGWTHTWDRRLLDAPLIARIETPNGDHVFAAKRTATSTTYEPLGAERASLKKFTDHFELREPDGTVSAFDPATGRLLRVTDPNGNQVTLAQGPHGPASLVHSNGDRVEIQYNAAGRITRVTDHAGRVTTYAYDAAGEHLVSVTGPEGQRRYGYLTGSGDAREHALVSILDPSGVGIHYEYDARGRLTRQVRTGDAEPVGYAYDLARITRTDGAGSATELRFDHEGRLHQATDGLGRRAVRRLDGAGRLVTSVRPDGSALTLGYDVRSALALVTDPDSASDAFTTDPSFDGLVSATDRSGLTTRYTYDSRGNARSIDYPSGPDELIQVDPRGELTRFTNRRSESIVLTRDARGLVTARSHNDGTREEYGYDSRGNLVTATGPRGTITLTYDDADRLLQVSYPGGRSISYGYDNAGRVLQRTTNDGFVVRYAYDGAGRLARVLDGAGDERARYSYDGAGRLARVDFANGTATTYAYDHAGQLTQLVNRAPGGVATTSFTVTYDDLGRRTSVTTPEGVTKYSYSPQGWLTAVELPGGRTIRYRYDDAGRRTSVEDGGSVTAYTVNALQQATKVGDSTRTYDADGNLTVVEDAAGRTTLVYDDESRLVRIEAPSGVTEYEYDALGNRVAVTRGGERTDYLVDPMGAANVVAEYRGSGLAARYVTGDLGPIALVEPSGASNFYDFDPAGSTVSLTGPDGTERNRYRYLPFGEPLLAEEAVPNPYTYSGANGATKEPGGLHTMRARFYEPSTGAFTSIDPLRKPVSLVHAFAANDPVSFSDPLGLEEVPPDVKKQLCKSIGKKASRLGGYGAAVDLGACRLDPEDLANAGCGLGRQGGGGFFNKNANDRLAEVDGFGPGTPTPCGPVQGPDTDGDGTDSGGVAVTSKDPNDIVGPEGVGDDRFITGEGRLGYVVNFENVATATAPAQEIVVTQTLDGDLDVSTFAWEAFGFGGRDHTVESPGRSMSVRLDRRADLGHFIDVTGELDDTTRQITWRIAAIDPTTLDLPLSVDAGVLPPNKTSPEGEGYVAYSIAPKAGLDTGTRIEAKARIFFDTNEPIDTPLHFNTVDAGVPTSAVDPLPETVPGESFEVSWSGSDADGSGVALFDVFVSTDGGPFQPFVSGTEATSATFTGAAGRTYGFFSVATDRVGRREADASGADAETRVVPPVTEIATTTVVTSSENPSSIGAAVTLTATVSAATGTPSGTVQFKDGNADLGGPVALTDGVAQFETPALLGGTHSITAVYGGSGRFLGSTSVALDQVVTCERTITGIVRGGLEIRGATCIEGADISGGLTIKPGASLSMTGSTVAGSLQGPKSPGGVVICGSNMASLSLIGAARAIVVGDPVTGCAGSAVTGSARLRGNRAGVAIWSTRVASLQVRDTRGVRTLIAGNTVNGSLVCTGNEPEASNGGSPNSVRGGRVGECADASF